MYYILSYIFGGQSVNTTIWKFIRCIPERENKILVNVGSGNRLLRDDIVNVDITPYKGVHIVADAAQLPLKDSSVDVVLCDQVLEHVADPQAIAKEIYRVLKRGGLVYVGAPFIMQFHSSPHDYYRWTYMGLEYLMNAFKKEELGVEYGPTAGAMTVLSEWLATLFSFGSIRLYNFFLIIFIVVLSPLKFFDLLIARYPTAKNACLANYFIGRKC